MRKTCAISALLLGIVGNAVLADQTEALQTLRDLYPGVQTNLQGSQLRSVYGRAMTTGQTPQESADRFRLDHANVFGAEPDDLIRGAPFGEGALTQPLMFDSETGEYKFTLVYYSQQRNGVPVFQSELRLLVRNEPGFPVVLAKSTLRHLGGFVPQRLRGGASTELAVAAAQAAVPGLVNFTEPQTVVWSGVNDVMAQPVTAITFIGDNGDLDGFHPQKQRFVVDAATGAILHQEDLILQVDVTGNVSGFATDGTGAEFCHPVALTPHPYARVFIGFPGVIADVNGDFVLPNAGTDDVTVTSTVQGEWFRTSDLAGSPSFLTPLVTPPGPVNLIHNEVNNEGDRAEVNAYLAANEVRDYVLSFQPAYPVIATQQSFPLTVNEAPNDFCPGNAQYNGSRLRFCAAASGFPNTAFSTVVHHEYGHHLVAKAGSGQGQYGEGLGDVMGLLITDESGTGMGFFGNCNAPLRDAVNNRSYPCVGEIHFCGQLLSGVVWETRNELLATEPAAYRDILSDLAINAILLHTGDLITPQITIDFLTLDDDDADLVNGSPHYREICTGFGAHNMASNCDPDCNFNELPDPWEIDQGLTADTNGNGIPDVCDPDCNGNLIPDDIDIANCAGNPACADCDANAVPDECDIAGCVDVVSCGDCDGNGVPNQCETAVNVEDCDGDGVCNAAQIAGCSGDPLCDDCNSNGQPDICDFGIVPDCNNNNVPDICDLDTDGDSRIDDCDNCPLFANPTQADCDSDGIGDVCATANGISPDGNGNSVPDECEFGSPGPAAYPHDRKKNRYISFDPNNAVNSGIVLAFKVELKSLTLGSCSGNGAFCREDRKQCSGSGDPCTTDGDCGGGETCSVWSDCNTCSIDGNACINPQIDCAPMPPQTCVATGEVCLNDAPDIGGTSVGQQWWVGPERPSLTNDVHLLVSESFRLERGDWPETVHVGDCEVVPIATYGIRAVEVTTGSESGETLVSTIDRPTVSNSWWADCVGPLKSFCNGDIRTPECSGDGDCGPGETCDPAWTLPDGAVNFDDVGAALALVAPGPTSTLPHVTWVDVHGNASGTPSSQNFDPPNYVTNFSDVGSIIQAFQGRPYTFNDPADCPDIGVWP